MLLLGMEEHERYLITVISPNTPFLRLMLEVSREEPRLPWKYRGHRARMCSQAVH
jgi:hypothetical protein